MYVAPNTVSGRVVNTSIVTGAKVGVDVVTGNWMRAPCERPIQLRCMVLTDSGHSSRSRSSTSRSA
jgi:hypothetical protein